MTCPNCGAPVIGWICDYCGTVFIDIQEVERIKQEILEAQMMEMQSHSFDAAMKFLKDSKRRF